MATARSTNYLHQRDNRTQLFGDMNGGMPPSSNVYRPGSSPGSTRLSTPSNRHTPELHPDRSPDFSPALMSQLESQNDEHIEGLSAKIQMLKGITVKIGEEVRDSTKMLGDMEGNFEGARTQLNATYKRMMYMAQRSGIPIKTWLIFFLVVFGFFFYMWL